MMEAPIAEGREEAKRGPRIQMPPSHVIDIVKDDDKKVRDLEIFQSDQELIHKLMGSEATPTYDKRYLNELVNSFSNHMLPINSGRYLNSFEGYSRAFKAYTEDKYYTLGNNLGGFVKSLVTLEENTLRDIDRDMNAGEFDFWAEVHGHFVSAWRLISHHIQEIRQGSFTLDDKLFFTPSYQKILAKSTVKYLEKDFLDVQIMPLTHNSQGYPLQDLAQKFEQYFFEHY
jgi:hypothetical protein